MRFVKGCAYILCGAVFGTALLIMALMKNPYGSLMNDCLKLGQEYYLYSVSSQAKISKSLTVAEYFSKTGEKSVFAMKSKKEADRYALKLLKEHRATVVCEENVAGVRSIYAYAPALGEGVSLFGKTVNLHLVVSAESLQVGVPLIFGGY